MASNPNARVGRLSRLRFDADRAGAVYNAAAARQGHGPDETAAKDDEVSISRELEYDTDELACQLVDHQRLIGCGAGERREDGVDRRQLLVGAGAAASALLAGSTAARAAGLVSDPPLPGAQFAGTLRVNTLGVEWPKGVREQAESDLGFKLSLETMTSVEQVERVLTAPDSFDVFSGYGYQMMRVWPVGHLRPIDTHRITAWPELYPLLRLGEARARLAGVPLRRRCRTLPVALPARRDEGSPSFQRTAAR